MKELRKRGYEVERKDHIKCVAVTFDTVDFIHLRFIQIEKHDLDYLIKYVRWMLS